MTLSGGSKFLFRQGFDVSHLFGSMFQGTPLSFGPWPVHYPMQITLKVLLEPIFRAGGCKGGLLVSVRFLALMYGRHSSIRMYQLRSLSLMVAMWAIPRFISF